VDHNREPWNSEHRPVGTAPESAATENRWLKKWILSALVLSYLVELIFTVFELDPEIKRPHHPFFNGLVFQDGTVWNGWVTDANFVYGFMEMAARGLVFLAASWAILYGIRMRIFAVCASLEIIDMFDYWLFRNDEWFNTGFEFNYLKIAIVVFCAWKEYRKSYTQM